MARGECITERLRPLGLLTGLSPSAARPVGGSGCRSKALMGCTAATRLWARAIRRSGLRPTPSAARITATRRSASSETRRTLGCRMRRGALFWRLVERLVHDRGGLGGRDRHHCEPGKHFPRYNRYWHHRRADLPRYPRPDCSNGRERSVVSAAGIKLNWTASSGTIAGYNVYRGTTSRRRDSRPLNGSDARLRHNLYRHDHWRWNDVLLYRGVGRGAEPADRRRAGGLLQPRWHSGGNFQRRDRPRREWQRAERHHERQWNKLCRGQVQSGNQIHRQPGPCGSLFIVFNLSDNLQCPCGSIFPASPRVGSSAHASAAITRST